MAKLDTLKTIAEITKLAIDGGVAVVDARRREREERERKAAAQSDEQKDRRIRELEAELAQLRGLR